MPVQAKSVVSFTTKKQNTKFGIFGLTTNDRIPRNSVCTKRRLAKRPDDDGTCAWHLAAAGRTTATRARYTGHVTVAGPATWPQSAKNTSRVRSPTCLRLDLLKTRQRELLQPWSAAVTNCRDIAYSLTPLSTAARLACITNNVNRNTLTLNLLSFILNFTCSLKVATQLLICTVCCNIKRGHPSFHRLGIKRSKCLSICY